MSEFGRVCNRNTKGILSLPCKDQFSGCLVGQCLGDTLGFPMEGRRWPRASGTSGSPSGRVVRAPPR